MQPFFINTIMIIIEDGTGLTNSNSYASVAAFDAYCSARKLTTALEASTSDKEAALIRATDYLDASYIFRSVTSQDSQALQNPRFGEEALNPKLVTATIELAILALARDLFATPTRGVLSKEVAAGKVSSKTVFDPSEKSSDPFPAITKMLRTLASRAGSSVQVGFLTR